MNIVKFKFAENSFFWKMVSLENWFLENKLFFWYLVIPWKISWKIFFSVWLCHGK